MLQVDDLYERDFFAWTIAQASELRRMAKRRVNSGLDLVHLAEEVEDLGRNERDAVRSQVRRILEHLLKLEYSSANDPRDSWKDSIDDARSVLEDKLTAALRTDVESVLPTLYGQVMPKCRRNLHRFGEDKAARALPDACPYKLDQVRQQQWYPPNRQGLVDQE